MRLIPALLLLLLTACGTDRRAVEEVMAQREKALATADIALYTSLLSPAYSDRGKDFAAKRAELEQTMKGFGPVSYRSQGRTVTVSADTATATGRYTMKVWFRGRPLELAGEETIRLRREAGTWKIIGGL